MRSADVPWGRNAVLVLLCVGLGAAGESQTRSLRIALLPFEDRAGFQGEWNLATDVPSLLGQYLSEGASVHVIPIDSVEAVAREKKLKKHQDVENAVSLGRYLGAEVVIAGRIDRFGMRRFTAGDPNFVGYKSYSSRIVLSDVRLIKVAAGKEVKTFEVSRDSVESPLGLDLFGRPRQQDREFRRLLKVEFGSEDFFELPFGQFADEVFGDLSAQIIRALVERPPLDLSGELAKVLSVEAKEVFLGVGSRDNVEHGDLLPLYKGDEQVALVEVNQILSSHLCRARIVERVGPVEAGLRIGQRVSLVKQTVK